ncbi:MAG: hypothetical protein AB7J46_01555 [Candidatus Altimarinota bacterium]
MKPLLKSLSFTALGMALIIGFQLRESSFTEVMAQISGRFVKPNTIASQQTNRSSNAVNLNSQIDYALPVDLELFNIVGTMYSGSTIQAEKYVSRISIVPLLQDINGDGLPDMIYSYDNKNYAGLNYLHQYVMLNNGKGFDLVYSCYRNNGTYTGDCAQ